MSRLWCVIVVLCTAGCVMPPGVTVVSVPVPSDSVRLFRYKVSSGSYLSYRVAARVHAPLARRCVESLLVCAPYDPIPIEREDVWHVTHVVGDHVLIQSRNYWKRLCNERGNAPQWDGVVSFSPFGNCVRQFDIAISINKDGSIRAGWQFIPRNTFVPVRYSIQKGSDNSNAGWPPGVVFHPIIK